MKLRTTTTISCTEKENEKVDLLIKKGYKKIDIFRAGISHLCEKENIS